MSFEQIAVMRREFRRRDALDLAEDVLRLLDFLSQADLAILHARRPLEVVHVVDLLQRHRDALEAVGDLARDRREIDPPDLLEIR